MIDLSWLPPRINVTVQPYNVVTSLFPGRDGQGASQAGIEYSPILI